MAQTINEIATNSIDPDPRNPRGQLTDEDPRVQEFAQQLRENPRIYQPIRVLKTGARYRLIIGERRWRAARLAGLKTIPAVVDSSLSEVDVREQQLAEIAQQSEIPKYRQYEVWAEHVQELVAGGMRRPEAISRVAAVLGKSERSVASVIGAGYVEAPQELKGMVEAGQMGPAVVALLNASSLAPNDRVKLGRKIANSVILTTGTTIQSELMPRIRKGDEIARRLIDDPKFSLRDAERMELARDLATQEAERREKLRKARDSEKDRPKTMGEVTFEIEGDLLAITSKLRSLNELRLVADLNLEYLKSALLVFNEQWEEFKHQLPPKFLGSPVRELPKHARP